MSWLSKGLDQVFGKKDTQTTQRSVDPRLWQHWNTLWGMGQQAAGASMDPRMAQAGGYYGNAMQAGQQGVNALAGDPRSVQGFMNPYQQNVLDQIQKQYGDLNAQAQMGINDQFTKAGAFGGTRQGVASGVASGEIAKGLGQQMAGMQYQGFNDAMQRANMLANFGMGGAQGAQGLGQYWQDRPLGILGSIYGMAPQGGFSEKQTKMGRGSFFDIAKGFFPMGAAGGGAGGAAGG